MDNYTKAVFAVVVCVISTTTQSQTFDSFSNKYCQNLQSNILFLDDVKTTFTLALQYQKTCEAGWNTSTCPFKSRDEADRWEEEVSLNAKITRLQAIGISVSPDDFAESLNLLIDRSMDRWGSICK